MPAWYGAAQGAEAVTPHNTTLLDPPAERLYVGVAGHLTLLMKDDTVVLFSNVPVGIFNVACKRVNSTGTTATNIVALW